MALIQTVHLSMASFKSAPVVPAVQNDTDRQVKMIIDDFQLTAGLTGKIAFQRSDGTHYETAATLNTSDNSFTADIDQALTQPGRTMVQLKVTDTLTVSTFSFVIFVEQDNSGTVTPQEGIDLVSAVQAAEDAADRAEAAAESLELDATLTSVTKAAQAKAVGDEIGELKSAIRQITGNDIIQFETKKFISLSGTTADVTNKQTPSGNCNCAVVSCAEGDKFTIFARGGAGARAWGFVDSNGTILSVCPASTNVQNEVITAPASAVYLVINDNSAPPSISYRGDKLLIDKFMDYIADTDYKADTAMVLKNLDFTDAPYNYGYRYSLPLFMGNGTLDTSTGADGSVVSTRVRSQMFWSDALIHISVPAAYRYTLFLYSKTDDSFVSYSTSWATGTAFLSSDYKYRLLIADADSFTADVSSTDVAKGVFAMSGDFAPVIADKHSTPICYGHRNAVQFSVDVGTISDTDGAENISASRLRTSLLESKAKIMIYPPYTGDRYRVFKYQKNEAHTFVGAESWTVFNTVPFIELSPDYAYRLIFANASWQRPDVDEIRNILILSGEASQDDVEIPTYFYPQLGTKVAEIRDNMMDAGKNGETFVFITDLHWEKNARHSPALIRYLLDKLNINYIVCGGDLINEGEYDAMAETVSDCVRAFNIKNTFFPCAFGNHDSNKNASNPSSEWFTVGGVYALMQKQSENHVTYFTESANGWNFYFDSPATKTRWIVCDTGEDGTYTQYTALASAITATPENYKIIFVAHWLYNSGAKSNFARNMELIVDAVNDRANVTLVDGTTTLDFTSAVSNAVCVIAGHLHNDMDWTSTNGIPFILTDSDNAPRSVNSRSFGTIDEQCFDVVTVDYSAETIKCVRIGYGSDRTFSF